jgi:hypothetical protein
MAALVAFYASLVFLSQIAMPAVMLLGLVDPWLGIRARLAPAPMAPVVHRGGTED